MVFTFAKSESSLLIGRPLSVSVAYSGRIAVAYKSGKSFKATKMNRRTAEENADSRYFNLVVSIYECESTGGKRPTIHNQNFIFFCLKYQLCFVNCIKDPNGFKKTSFI